MNHHENESQNVDYDFWAHVKSVVLPIFIMWRWIAQKYADVVYPLPVTFYIQNGASTQFQPHAPIGSILIDKAHAKKFGLLKSPKRSASSNSQSRNKRRYTSNTQNLFFISFDQLHSQSNNGSRATKEEASLRPRRRPPIQHHKEDSQSSWQLRHC